MSHMSLMLTVNWSPDGIIAAYFRFRGLCSLFKRSRKLESIPFSQTNQQNLCSQTHESLVSITPAMNNNWLLLRRPVLATGTINRMSVAGSVVGGKWQNACKNAAHTHKNVLWVVYYHEPVKHLSWLSSQVVSAWARHHYNTVAAERGKFDFQWNEQSLCAFQIIFELSWCLIAYVLLLFHLLNGDL